MDKDNGNTYDDTPQKRNRHRTLSTQEFYKYGGGICYDYVNVLNSLISYPHKCFFIGRVDPKKNNGGINPVVETHTFIYVYVDEYIYHVECSTGVCSVRRYTSENDALSYMTNKFHGTDVSYIVKYAPNNSWIGLSIDEFINKTANLPEYRFKYINDPKVDRILYSMGKHRLTGEK